jgi:hypothetical protein
MQSYTVSTEIYPSYIFAIKFRLDDIETKKRPYELSRAVTARSRTVLILPREPNPTCVALDVNLLVCPQLSIRAMQAILTSLSIMAGVKMAKNFMGGVAEKG